MNLNFRYYFYIGFLGSIFFINPLVSIFLLGLFAIFDKVPLGISIFSTVIFSFFIVFRWYGIDWSETGHDDAPVYFEIIKELGGHSFYEVISSEIYPEIEIIPKIIWWIIFAVTDSIFFILIFQSLLWFLSILALSFTVSKRYYPTVFSIGVLLLPNIFLINVLNLYRSAWAMLFINITYVLIIKNSRTKAIFFGAISSLCHVAALPFTLILILLKTNKLVPLLLISSLLLYYFNDYNISFYKKILIYLDSIRDISIEAILRNILFCLLAFFLFLNTTKNIQHIIAFITLLFSMIMGFFPNLYDIHVRLAILYIPSAIIVLAGSQKKNVILSLYAIVLIRLFEILFSENSILKHTYGIFTYPLRVPILDFIFFFNDYDSILGE